MEYRITSYRNGFQILAACPALEELGAVLAGISLADVDRRRQERQTKQAQKAGIQAGLNAALREALTAPRLGWAHEVPIFKQDAATRKGFWTMDFRKTFGAISVGVEVTFNHQEALPWTLIRPTLAHEDDNALPDSGIDVGVIIIGTDSLKGTATDLRMDSAVGTYERLVTLLPRMKSVLPAPLVIVGLNWKDGAQVGGVEEISIRRRPGTAYIKTAQR